MPHFKTDDISIWTNGTWKNLGEQKPEIKGFSTDSRNISPSFAFIALKAERDGHDFVLDAIKNGATAIIASKEIPESTVPVLLVKDTMFAFQQIAKFHRLRFDNPVIGITGSCGKTSTKEFLGKLLSWKNPLITKENFNNEIGVPLTLTSIDLKINQAAIIEAGVAAPGQMLSLAKMIEPELAIITNVGLAHMENFVELSQVAKEKAILAQNVAEGGWALFHHELLSWKAFEELQCKKAIVVPVGAGDTKADLVFRYSLIQSETGSKLDISIDNGYEYYFDLPQLSDGLTQNAILAVAAALMLGAREEQIMAKLERFAPLPMRGGIFEIEESKYYIDCYNASPTSMKDALKFFLKMSEDMSRLFVVGEMAELGLSAHRHHKEIGSILPYRNSDKAILVGEHANIYKDAMLEKGWPEESIILEKDYAAIAKIIEEFKGFVFVKASRVCKLETALPQSVKTLLEIHPQEEIPEEDTEEIVEEIKIVTQSEKEDLEDDDNDDDDFENVDFEGTIDDEDDSEDERERF